MRLSLTVTNCAKQIASIVDIDNFTDYFPPSTDMRSLVLRKPGKADLDQAVSLVVPLEQAADALRSWSDNPSSFTKIMVNMD
jgi:hypothetical protein